MDSTILVVGDAHVGADDPLVRFDYANELIMDKRPDKIIIMGDFLTLNCLSAWDMNKRMKMEGRRYFDEIVQGNEALDRMFHGLNIDNQRLRKNKKKLYIPDIIYIEGNHEDRLTRYMESDPTFQGTVSIPKDLQLAERAIKWVPYREYYHHNGIAFTHIPHNSVKPVSGKYHVHKAMDCTIQSVVYGHTHKLETACRHVPGMKHLQQVLSAGCFFEHDEEYVHGLITNYWKGLILLNNYKEGRFDIATYSLGRMRRTYMVESK